MLPSDRILTVAQMRAAEDKLIAQGSSVEDLMDRAGRGAAEWVWRIAAGHRVTVLCGPGNNGGDGYVIAQALRERGGDVVVIAAAEPRTQAARAARALFTGEVCDDTAMVAGEVFVDCLYGSGLSRPLSASQAALLARCARSHRQSIAIDVPSGIDADGGHLPAEALPDYHLTLALGAWKPAHVLLPAVTKMGALRLVDIGVEAGVDVPWRLAQPKLKAPATDAHKYSRGLVAVVGGAMPGAAALGAEAALRAGGGYVRLSAPAAVRASHAIVQSSEPDFDKAGAILVGPGLGRDGCARSLLEMALAAPAPVVADADALSLLAVHGSGVGLPAPAIITPHEGEFVRLFGADGAGPAMSKIDRARAAASGGSVVVYKGADTIIAAPDGRVAVAPPASSWLSTAGTGDVLAGICAARLAVTGDPFMAACEAVWVHREAAQLAGASFAADDLVACLPAAIGRCL